MFRSCTNKGFHLTFDNGWSVSVQWGKGNMCERRDFSVDAGYGDELREHIWESSDAEVMAWHDNEDGTETTLRLGRADVCVGRLTTDEVARLIHKVAHLARDASENSITFLRGR